tara:strand:+ start:455 stop:811 length:357 start_codon:yes stop_codon:yes gene_type:complete
MTAETAPSTRQEYYGLPERRAFGLRQDRSYWAGRARRRHLVYMSSFAFAVAWMVFSLWLSLPWLADLGRLSHPVIAITVLAFTPSFSRHSFSARARFVPIRRFGRAFLSLSPPIMKKT